MWSKYPKLCLLNHMMLKPKGCMAELAAYVDFHGSRTVSEYQRLARLLRDFHRTVEDIFEDSLGVASGDVVNLNVSPSHLRDDEIKYIRRAHVRNSSSRALFDLLRGSITCANGPGMHNARIHLPSDWDGDFDFNLLVACEGSYWRRAKCKWFVRSDRLYRC